MINIHAMFDELEKIAEEHNDHQYEYPDVHKYDTDSGNNFITKDRLKRLAVAATAIGVGGAVGNSLGVLVGKKLNSPWGIRKGLQAPDWVHTYGPAAAGILVALGGILPQLNDHKKYIQYGKSK